VKDGPKWEYKDRFAIHDRMIEVVKLTREAAEAELAAARSKLRKMQYGS